MIAASYSPEYILFAGVISLRSDVRKDYIRDIQNNQGAIHVVYEASAGHDEASNTNN